jgi:hypothetical protein
MSEGIMSEGIMRSASRRLPLTLGLACMLLAIAPAVTAAAAPVTVPVGPNQFFGGLVNGSNGSTSPVPIRTNCLGPVTAGETGHPLAGQTVEVVLASPASSNIEGFTGSAAKSIVADLIYTLTPTGPTFIEQVATFTSYNVAEPIPVTITVPCSGDGLMSFMPNPGSPTAKPATVQVVFVSQP